jgi:hypothetical protein
MLYKYIPNFDYLFNDKAFIKGFIWQVAKTCNELKIETNNQFDFIFEKENRMKNNTYLLLDYNIISIAFINFMNEYKHNNIFYKKIIKSYLLNKYDNDINLLTSLAKLKIVYFHLNMDFYTEYQLYRYTKNDLFILEFKGIAINLKEIRNILENDTEVFNDFTILIKNNYYNFKNYKFNRFDTKHKLRRYKKYNFFNIEKIKTYKNTFKDKDNEK